MIVYAATSPTGKQYVGQTVHSLKVRKTQHKSNAKTGKRRSYFLPALVKYGFENFTWDTLETCLSLEELNKGEIFWIEELNTLSPNGYNLNMGGEAGGLPSEETKRRMSIAQKKRASFPEETRKRMGMAQKKRAPASEETRRKISKTLMGHSMSEETRQKISKTKLTRKYVISEETRKRMSRKGKKAYWYGKHHSPETKEKIRLATTGKKQSQETIKKRVATMKKNPPSAEARYRMGSGTRGKSPSVKTRKLLSKARIRVAREKREAIEVR